MLVHVTWKISYNIDNNNQNNTIKTIYQFIDEFKTNVMTYDNQLKVSHFNA